MSSTYVIGDVQGCYRSLMALLEKVHFDATKDRLWLVGDLVNRGPDSLATLRWLCQHDHAVDAVLGNHDIALLALQWGLRKPKPLDTLDEVLAAEDCDALLQWLRTRPLLIEDDRHVMLHAGVTPTFDLEQTRACARRIEQAFADAATARQLVAVALGKVPDAAPELVALGQALRMMTNLRVVDANGEPDFSFKGPVHAIGPGRSPWFAHLRPAAWPKQLLVGHWSALGLHRTPYVTALDSGCVWGGSLTALRLEDQQLIQVPTQELHPLSPDED